MKGPQTQPCLSMMVLSKFQSAIPSRGQSPPARSAADRDSGYPAGGKPSSDSRSGSYGIWQFPSRARSALKGCDDGAAGGLVSPQRRFAFPENWMNGPRERRSPLQALETRLMFRHPEEALSRHSNVQVRGSIGRFEKDECRRIAAPAWDGS